MKIYIAGPMTGLPEFNFPAFFEAAEYLQAEGHDTFNPAAKDKEIYGDDVGSSPTGDVQDAAQHGFDIREALFLDLQFICKEADALYMLEGWERSTGARAEHATATALHLPAYYSSWTPPMTNDRFLVGTRGKEIS